MRALPLAALALLLACRSPSPPPRPRLVQARAQDRGVGEWRGIVDQAALARRAGKALAAGGLVDLALDAPPRPRLDYRLDVTCAVDGEGGRDGLLRARLEARLQRVDARPGEAPIEAGVLAERPFSGDLGPTPLGDHAARAADDLGRVLSRLLAIHLGDTARLIAALADPEQTVREEAMRVAGSRRERTAVPALIAKLSLGDSRERDLAIGALVEIGDPAAVPALTHGARFDDEADLVKRLDAVAAIGGAEARGFLEFVAASHRDPETRDLASRALRRLARPDAAARVVP